MNCVQSTHTNSSWIRKLHSSLIMASPSCFLEAEKEQRKPAIPASYSAQITRGNERTLSKNLVQRTLATWATCSRLDIRSELHWICTHSSVSIPASIYEGHLTSLASSSLWTSCVRQPDSSTNQGKTEHQILSGFPCRQPVRALRLSAGRCWGCLISDESSTSQKFHLDLYVFL